MDVTKAGTVARRLQVTQPKSDSSLRVVNELPANLCARLTAHVAGRGREAFIFGEGTTPHSHVNFYSRVFRPVVLALGLACRFHDLRHYHASACIEAGMTPLYVAHRLGHADAVLVLRTYGHLFPTAGNGLADRLASIRAAAPDAPSIGRLNAKG